MVVVVVMQVMVFWVMTPRNDVVGHQHFGGLCCFLLHGEGSHDLDCDTI